MMMFIGLPAGAQNTFQQIWSVKDSMCSGNNFAVADDGSVFISGLVATTPSAFDRQYDGLIWKTDPQGNILWTNRLKHGSIHEVRTFSLQPTSDGGCIVLVFYVLNSINSKVNATILKLKSDGTHDWVRQLKNSDHYFFDIVKINGGYLVTGITRNLVGSPVIKIDESGNTLWSLAFNGFELKSNGAYEYPNGDILIPGGSGKGGWVKLNSAGEILSSWRYADTTDIQLRFGTFFNCTPVGDSLLFIGYSYTSNTLMAMKTDHAGNPGSTRRYGITGGVVLLDIKGDEASGFVLCCLNKQFNKTYLLHLKADMTIDWAKTYGKGGGNVLQCYGVVPAPDGGFLITGDITKGNKLSMYLAHTNEKGEVPGICCDKPVEVNYLPCPVKKEFLGYTTDTLSELTEAVLVNWLTQTQVKPFCETTHEIQLSDTTICPVSCLNIALNTPQQGSTYTWDLPGASPDSSLLASPGQVCYVDSGTYPAFLKQDGCLVDSTLITVDNPDDQFPNAFTPNNDGVNETFRPLITCPVEEFTMEIFNRWGVKIFETTDPETGWDGNVNGQPAPVDTYIYRVQFFAVKGTERLLVKNEMKEVTLLR